MSKHTTVYARQDDPKTHILVSHFVADDSKGLAIFVNGALRLKCYNPAEITAWFTANRAYLVDQWRSAYHRSGLTGNDYKRPAPTVVAPVAKASDYTRLIPAPSRAVARAGLSPATHATALRLLGRPGAATKDCSGITNDRLVKRMVLRNLTPWLRVYGFDLFVNSLQEIMNEIKETHPVLYPIIGTAGVVCCRHVRDHPGVFSNHSWGTAIDFKIGGILAPLNATMIPAGLVTIAGIARKHKLFWAQGFNGRTDPMHIEASQELLLEWERGGKLW